MKKFEPKKILVPVDFSDFSQQALSSAAEIAELRGAEITVMHVMVEPQTSVPYEVYIDWQKVKGEIKADAEKLLGEMAEKACVSKKAAKVLVWGEPASVVNETAESGGFDLIVMATHGRTGLSRLFLGSVAENVIRHAHCPVLVMRTPQYQTRGFNRKTGVPPQQSPPRGGASYFRTPSISLSPIGPYARFLFESPGSGFQP